MNECNSKRKNELVVSLSDDVQIDTILVSNQEDFSASLAEITFYGSVEPPDKNQWTRLGSIIPEQSVMEGHDGIHILEIGGKYSEPDFVSSVPMIRFLKVEMEAPSENDNGLLCTLNKVAVFGTSMHQVMRNSLKGLGSTSANNDQAAAETAEPEAEETENLINL